MIIYVLYSILLS